jgi:hypothetical protein
MRHSHSSRRLCRVQELTWAPLEAGSQLTACGCHIRSICNVFLHPNAFSLQFHAKDRDVRAWAPRQSWNWIQSVQLDACPRTEEASEYSGILQAVIDAFNENVVPLNAVWVVCQVAMSRFDDSNNWSRTRNYLPSQ